MDRRFIASTVGQQLKGTSVRNTIKETFAWILRVLELRSNFEDSN